MMIRDMASFSIKEMKFSKVYPSTETEWTIIDRYMLDKTTRKGQRVLMKIMTKAKCIECGRVFDLLNELDAEEWSYGHDCES